jgi:hypothetical protein
VTALSLAAACEARVPTATEIQSMDAAGAERTALRTGLAGAVHGAGTVFYVNDVKVSATEAHAIVPNDIATVNVEAPKQAGGPSTIRIRTVAVGAEGMKYRTGSATPQASERSSVGAVHEKMSLAHGGAIPLIMIDGTRADGEALHRLDPKNILSVEVIKGPRATEMLADPAAKNGVVKVTTTGARARQ